MLTFGEKKSNKRKVSCPIKHKKIWDVNIDNIVISKLVRTKTNSKYLIGYSDKALRPLIFCVDDEKLLDKYKQMTDYLDENLFEY